MLFETEEQRKVFGFQCTLAEKDHTEKTLDWVNQEIDKLNTKIESVTQQYQESQVTPDKEDLKSTMIQYLGKVRTLYTYQKVLKYQLSEVRNTERNSGTLGYRAKVALGELSKNDVFMEL